MAVDNEILAAFATAATAGVGHGVGRAFIGWFFERWRKLTGAGTAATDPVIRAVTPEQLDEGLPAGTLLCRYQGDHLVQKYQPGDELPETLAKNETLWLVPAEERWLNAAFDVSDSHYAVQVGVEVDPQSGQGLQPAEIAEMDWSDVGGLLSGLLTGLAVGGGMEALAKGEPEAIRKSQQKLNESLRKRGLRCKGIRPVPTEEALRTASSGGGIVATGIPGELVGELEQLQTPEAWNQFINTLSASGVPWSQGTLNQLQQMQDQFLKQQVSPEKTVRSLAQLTEAAFVEAGIEDLNLSRCQAISRCLQAEETATAGPQLAAVSVVSSGRPSTWYVWTQAEADRRLIDYTRRSLRHCKAACDQALRSLRHLPSLRLLKDWNEQLMLTTELLDSSPNLKPRTSSLRANSGKTKELSKLLQDTAITAEQLAQHGKKLFDQPTGSPDWEQTLRACQQSTSLLQQLIQDRRLPH